MSDPNGYGPSAPRPGAAHDSHKSKRKTTIKPMMKLADAGMWFERLRRRGRVPVPFRGAGFLALILSYFIAAIAG